MRYVTFFVAMAGCDVDRAQGPDEEGSSGESDGTEGLDAEPGPESEAGEESGESTGEPAVDPERQAPADLAGEACGAEADLRYCDLAGPTGIATGIQACAASERVEDPALSWSPCVEALACTPGETVECAIGTAACIVLTDGTLGMQECGFTPLAIDLDGTGIRFEPAAGRAFDIAANGACLDVDWPIASVAWLAIDRDGDGAIADGSELFGSGTPMEGGVAATDGFLALAPLDDDGDGAITARDSAFARLVLWTDHDGDRRGTAGELVGLAQLGITTLPLAYERRRECDARGNCIVERATVTTSAGARPLVDLHLTCQ
jgi:hypothetical protein